MHRDEQVEGQGRIREVALAHATLFQKGQRLRWSLMALLGSFRLSEMKMGHVFQWHRWPTNLRKRSQHQNRSQVSDLFGPRISKICPEIARSVPGTVRLPDITGQGQERGRPPSNEPNSPDSLTLLSFCYCPRLGSAECRDPC